MRYLVVIDGAGEYESDFSVVVVKAANHRDALDRVISPEMGYGKDDDGVAYVAALHDVIPYQINSTRRKKADTTTFDEVVQSLPVNMRQYLDLDGGHEEAARLNDERLWAAEQERIAQAREIITTPVDDVSEVAEKIRDLKA